MSKFDNAVDIGRGLIDLALKHPDAVRELGKAFKNVASSKDPLETAKRAAAATASGAVSEEVLKKALGRKKS